MVIRRNYRLARRGLIYLAILTVLLGTLTSADTAPKELTIHPPYTAAALYKQGIPYCPFPRYPYKARLEHWSGTGVFVLYIRPDGTVSSVGVAKSTGYPILDQAGIAAFQQW